MLTQLCTLCPLIKVKLKGGKKKKRKGKESRGEGIFR